MIGISGLSSLGTNTQAVVPVLIGPIATLTPILVGALFALTVGIARFVVRLFTPVGMRDLVMFFWHQKTFTVCLTLAVGGTVYGSANNWWRKAPVVAAAVEGQEWSAFRGGPARSGAVPGAEEPTTGDVVWSIRPRVPGRLSSIEFKTFYASPAVVGNRVYVSGAEKGPLTDRGAVFCIDTDTGDVAWQYAPGDFRATFSSPSVAYKHDANGKSNYKEGYLVVGEGLHYTTNARVNCLTLDGKPLWEFRTKNHVESSPAIADGRVYIGSGDDGYWCFDLEPKDPDKKEPNVVWHKGGIGQPDREKYCDCETSPVVEDGVCYFGLGNPQFKDELEVKGTGKAVVAVDAKTGQELWRIASPYPVFTGPTIGHRIVMENGKPNVEKLLFVGTGNGDFVNSGEKLKQEKVAKLREMKLSPEQIAEETRNMGLAGEVWCINLSSFSPDKPASPPKVDWKFPCRDTVLVSIAYAPPAKADQAGEGRLYFGSRDSRFYCLSTAGKKLAEPFNAGSPIVTSAAVGTDYVYFATEGGTMHCLSADKLSPIWQVALAGGAMSSPVLADGHIYIGTNNDGFRCIGRVKPPTPAWTAGLTGGAADRTPIQQTTRFVARYPGESDGQFEVTAPLTPLARIRVDAEGKAVGQPEKFIYVPAVRDGKPQLLKLRHGELGKKDVDPVMWSSPFEQPIRVAPAAIGTELLVVAGGGGEQSGTLFCVDAADGGKRWQAAVIQPGGSGQFAIDGRYVFLWSGPETLACVDREKAGAVVWQTQCPGGPGVGAPSAGGGMVAAATADELVTLDGGTGAVLWSRKLPAAAVFGPTRMNEDVLLATEAGLSRWRLLDGSVLWSETEVGRVAQPPLADDEKIIAVSDSGKLFVLDAATGLSRRLKDGVVTEAGGPVRVERRMAPLANVDKRVVPLLSGERVVFGGLKGGDPAAAGDLMILTLPEKYEPEAAGAPTSAPADVRNTPATGPDAAGRAERVTVAPTRWCQTAFLGPIRTPLVAIDGQTYFATDKYKLVFLKAPN